MQQSSQQGAKPLRGLRRLKRLSDQQEGEQKEIRQETSKPKDNKKENKKRNKTKSKKKKQVDTNTEPETAEEQIVTEKQHNTKVQDYKAIICKSSEDEDDETPIGFVGLETKVTRKRQAKKDRKSIKVSNRFFKDQNFDNFGPEEAPPAYELCQLQIQKREVQPKSASLLLHKAEQVKKHRGVYTSQQEVVDNQSIDKNIKQMLSKPIDESTEVEIQIEIPRHNAGKNNAILDGTLFVKQHKSTIVTMQATQIDPPQLKKKAKSRNEYFRQMNDDIKNRRSMRMSITDISEAFVPSSLDDLEKKGQTKEILTGITQAVSQKGNVVTVLVKTTSREELKEEVSKEVQEQREVNKQQPEKNTEVSKELKKETIKQPKQSKPKKPKKQKLNIFQDEAEQSGKENPSESEQQGDSQVENLFDDNIELNQENEQRARQKFHEQQMQDDREIIRRIVKKQFKQAKAQKEKENKDKRIEDAKRLLDQREQISELLPLLPFIDQPEEQFMNIVQKPTKAIQNYKWTFSEPAPAQLPTLQRRSLLPSSSDGIHLPRQQKANKKYIGSAVNKIIKPM